MNFKLLNPSKYLSGVDLPADATFTIKAVSLSDLEGENGKTERRGTIALLETDKPWLSNVTNSKCLAAMFGDETDRWVGKRVVVFQERVLAFGEWVPGVRVRGSPDLAAPVSVSVKLRKKKTQTLTMLKTGAGANGAAKPAAAPAGPVTTVTFGKEQGWKDKPIASFDSAQLGTIIDAGEKMCTATPTAGWVKGVQACITAIRANLEARVTAEPPEAEAP